MHSKSSSTTTPSSSIKSLVSDAKKRRKNRVYYRDCFHITNLKNSGLVRCDDKAKLDYFVTDKGNNESIQFYAFDQLGSHFHLSLDILTLNRDSEELRWKLVKVNLRFLEALSRSEYTYQSEELLDYDEKRSNNQDDYERKRVLRVGPLSVEVIEPFGLYRILFNGFLNRKQQQQETSQDSRISAKLSIATAPTSDKFDYQYSFDTDYLARALERESTGTLTNEQLLQLALEDRIDQPLMFQGRLEFLSTSPTTNEPLDFIMWGSKVKKVLSLDELYHIYNSEPSTARESIYLWAECGHTVHLNRPVANPDLIYGMTSSNLDYASYLYDVKLLKKEEDGGEVETSFNQIRSFEDLKEGSGGLFKVVVKGFQTKQYNIEVHETSKVSVFNANNDSDGDENCNLLRISINGFKGWAYVERYDLVDLWHKAQQHLWTLTIGDRKFGQILANERLLGGKGNSLMELSRLISGLDSISPLSLASSGSTTGYFDKLSIPKGIIVSCVAYTQWLNSSPILLKSINKLDCIRRTVAARSVYTNPYADESLSLAQSQSILREACEKTTSLLRTCPLPETLRQHLRVVLNYVFSQDELSGKAKKLFAVRSSAVGEDTLETSAAGQMKTILDASSFDSICSAIIECWSSQFEVEAVSYKTQNGMDFNLPMAVVVQELIGCRVAGVAATCDPLTGDKSRLEILANVGLGEGVVEGKETDTIRVGLDSMGLKWDPTIGAHSGQISVEGAKDSITKLPRGVLDEKDEPKCCLDDAEIVYLANLLLHLRRVSSIKEREIEWGITDTNNNNNHNFQVHLLQSRPLTHLNRLSSREIDHGLDSGMASPLDVVSRANIGEVMPGSMCAMNMSYFSAILTGQGRNKPFEVNHTRTAFSGDTFSFHGTVAAMILTYTDMTTQFRRKKETNDDMEVALRTMIGTSEAPAEERNRLEVLKEERLNPVSRLHPEGLPRLLALDSGGLRYLIYNSRKIVNDTKLNDDLVSLEHLIDCFEQNGDGHLGSLDKRANETARLLYDRLCSRIEPLMDSWRNHIRATLLSMAFNVMCMRALVSQSAYATNDMSSAEILNDFSVLMQSGASTANKRTESGDISHLLKVLLENLTTDGLVEKLKTMSDIELYRYLTKSAPLSSKGAQLFRKFMSKNGHRAYKEFDFASLTWADEPSCIIKSLMKRLKSMSEEEIEREVKLGEKKSAELKVKFEEIMLKVDKNKTLLTAYLLPRARNATIRREQTKSLIIKAVDKYRKAFRYLGGLLCLQGKLPDASLIFQVSFHELYALVHSQDRSDFSRIIYKARRRQQRSRILNKIAYPRPVLSFPEMVELIRAVSDERQVAGKNIIDTNGNEKRVSGMTSCAGLITGRACVVSSLEEMDQLEANDILITYSIDISWSIYFYTLGGIVTEVGGIVSHGAVVAREYGIPTLCSAVGACSMFRTGQQVTLDANAGVCYLAE